MAKICARTFRDTIRSRAVKTGQIFAAISGLAMYFGLLEKKGKDPKKYDTLPVDAERISQIAVEIQNAKR